MGFRVRSDFKKGMLDRELERLVDDAAEAWVDESKSRAHVITGQLRDSIRKEKTGKLTRRVLADPSNSSGDGYAAHENYGTRYRPGHPFWEPGEKAAEDSIRRAKLS